MNISLTPELERIVRRKVDSGLYNNASEVIREALRLMVEQERMEAMKLELLRAEIDLAGGKPTVANLYERRPRASSQERMRGMLESVLTRSAESDLIEIARYNRREWGERQRDKYFVNFRLVRVNRRRSPPCAEPRPNPPRLEEPSP